jgi:Rod binding domain-containing protein
MGTSMGIGALGAQVNAIQSDADRLIQGVKSKSATDSAKIEKGAKEFEAVLVGSWLQQAEQSFATVPGADEGQDVGRDSMMSLGVQTLATSMAATGGIGIAKMVAKAMHTAAAKADRDGPAVEAAPPETGTAGMTPVPSQEIEKKNEKRD